MHVNLLQLPARLSEEGARCDTASLMRRVQVFKRLPRELDTLGLRAADVTLSGDDVPVRLKPLLKHVEPVELLRQQQAQEIEEVLVTNVQRRGREEKDAIGLCR